MWKVQAILMAVLLIGSTVAQSNHVFADPKESDPLNSEIPEFGQGTVLVSSSTTSAVDIIKMKLSSLSSTDIQNLGQEVSMVAKLHKLLAKADKEERDEFKRLFHEYKAAVKEILGIGQGAKNNIVLHEFKKDAIKIEHQIAKLEEKDLRKENIKKTIEISQQTKDLQKVLNKIAILEHSPKLDEKKEDKLYQLKEKKLATVKQILTLEATKNGEKLTQKDIDKIEEEAKKSVEKSGNSNKGSSDNKGNSGDSNGKGNGNSGSNNGNVKGNSGSDKSDKSNSGKSKSNKSNNGKGKK